MLQLENRRLFCELTGKSYIVEVSDRTLPTFSHNAEGETRHAQSRSKLHLIVLGAIGTTDAKRADICERIHRVERSGRSIGSDYCRLFYMLNLFVTDHAKG